MFVQMDPAAERRFRAAGLCDFQSMTAQAGEVVGGHPNRNVARWQWRDLRGFIKREYRTPLKDFLASWWAGFGLACKSVREWNTLLALRQHGLSCPEPLAVGCQNGQAFLLVRELPDAVDLHTCLAEHCTRSDQRRSLARILGETIARLHAAGFTHPDLYAKHVFVQLRDRSIVFIDFQRTMRRPRVSWRRRWRDLAALNASLGDELVSFRERLGCLVAYLRQSGVTDMRRSLRSSLRALQRRTAHLLGRRKIQRMRGGAVSSCLNPEFDGPTSEAWQFS